MRPAYPWSAVVGQAALKQALILSAIDPSIGGVLIAGPRGVAKTTLARALGELIEGAFVELPLGASDERVTGTLDLGVALREGSVQFAPGLLARAHDGVLYVDEVNLLPDALVDLLLDAAASGQNVVERDGVSHAHPARFVLIGTMNPEEGELRPQLTDRFGLSVSAEAEIRPEERAEIVTRRLAYEADPAAFVAGFAAAQAELVARCRRARDKVSAIPLVGPALTRVTEHCYAAGVEGLRADLAMLRAARAHAAWHDRDAITDEDVDAVAELALAHRRRHASEPPRSGPSGAPPSGGPSRGGTSGDGRGASTSPTAREPTSAAPAQRDHDGTRGALAPVAVSSAAPKALPGWLTAERGLRAEARRQGRSQRVRGARGRARRTDEPRGEIDWFASLARRGRRPLTVADLRFRTRRGPTRKLWVLALDCSASMLRSGALAEAKGVVRALEARALCAGAHVALVTFQGGTAQLALAPIVRGAKRLSTLEAVGGGGGTPLRAAVSHALTLCDSRHFRGPEVEKRILLLTDGRTRERLDDLAPGRPDVAIVIVDCERGPVRLGRTNALATALGGRAVHLDTLAART